MNDALFRTVEPFLRNAAAGYSLALLLLLILAGGSERFHRLRTGALRCLILIGCGISLCYPVLILWYLTDSAPDFPFGRLLYGLLTSPGFLQIRIVFLLSLLLPLPALSLWRRRPRLAALLLVVAVNADWVVRIIGIAGSLGPGYRRAGHWYEDPVFLREGPGAPCLLFAAVFFGLAYGVGYLKQQSVSRVT